MARTRTVLVDIRKLQKLEAEGVIVLRLMMACNDIVTANKALGACRTDADEKAGYIRRGEAMYHVRLQLGHLKEALDIVRQIRDSPRLQAFIGRCPVGTANDFAELLSFTRGGARHREFRQYIELVRHKVTFHYDSGMVTSALRDRALRRGETAHFMTFADGL